MVRGSNTDHLSVGQLADLIRRGVRGNSKALERLTKLAGTDDYGLAIQTIYEICERRRASGQLKARKPKPRSVYTFRGGLPGSGKRS